VRKPVRGFESALRGYGGNGAVGRFDKMHYGFHSGILYGRMNRNPLNLLESEIKKIPGTSEVSHHLFSRKVFEGVVGGTFPKKSPL
jgi:hypothetical protein